MLVVGILVGLIVMTLLVVVHELGHGIVARRNGVVVEEFGIGFPPKAWGKKIARSTLGKNVLFTVNWLPLGGFVKLQGEHDAARGKGDYGAASYWVKTKILLAGVLMNWLVAAVLLTILALVGLPKILPNQFSIAADTHHILKPVEITQVEAGSPAQKAGLKTGDQILGLGGQAASSSESLANTTKAKKGQTIDVVYRRSGTKHTVPVHLRADNSDKKGYLGIGSNQREELRATWSAPIVGVPTAAQFTWVTLEGTGHIVYDAARGAVRSLSFSKDTRNNGKKELGAVSDSVAGPVGILGKIFPQAEAAGLKSLVFLSAVISLSLAVMNVLPIPALDGGRWFTMSVFRLLRKPLTKEREEKIQTAGFLALMSLVVLITVADVGKFF